jgi:hypothetical protein
MQFYGNSSIVQDKDPEVRIIDGRGAWVGACNAHDLDMRWSLPPVIIDRDSESSLN